MKKEKKMLSIIVMIIIFSSIGVYADNSCRGLFGDELISKVREVFDIVKIVVPVLLLLLTSIDFAKVVFSDNKDGMKKAMDNFVKRAVAALIVFFAPMIVELIMKFVDMNTGCVSEFMR